MTVAITPTVQDTWPPRVALAVTGLTAHDVVTVYRVVGGVRTAVRATSGIEVPGTTLATVDAELPFGVPVTWTVRRNGADAASTAPTTYTLPGGQVALTDAITGQAAEVAIGAWPTRRRERRASSFALTRTDGVGFTAVVSGAAGQRTSQVELVTLTNAAADTLDALLASATGAVVQLRVPDEARYTRASCYLAVVAWEEQRWSQDGSDAKRRWALETLEVSGWSSDLAARNWTLDDLAGAYPGGTLADIAADFPTLLDLAVADIGAL